MRKVTMTCLSLMIAIAGVAQDWELIRSTADLRAGDQLVFAYVDGAVTASASLSSNNSKSAYWLAPITSTFSDGQLTSIGEGTGVFTLEGESGAWKFAIEGAGGTIYYLGAIAAKKLSYASNATHTWTIAIADGEATIVSTNSSYGTFYYNNAPNSQRFSVFTSTGSMKKPSLFRIVTVNKYALSYEGFPYAKTACDAPVFAAGSTVTLSTGAPSVNGKTFLGWEYEGVLYQPGASFVMPEAEVVLKAKWSDAQGVENQMVNGKSKNGKYLRDGQLIIVRDGMEFNILGTRVR